MISTTTPASRVRSLLASGTAVALIILVTGVFSASAATTFTTNSISTDGTLSVTGNATFDTTTMFVDATNNRVGFGTTSPSQRLELEGAGATEGIVIDSTATDGDGYIQFQDAGTAVWTMGWDDGDGDKFKLGTTDVGTNPYVVIDSTTGDVELGKGIASGTVTFNATVDSHVIPTVDDTYDLGSSTKRWRHSFFGPDTVYIGADGDEVQLKYDTANDLLVVTKSQKINVIDTNNASTVDLVTLLHRGTSPASGIGSGVLFASQDNASNEESIARISAALSNATDGSEAGVLKFFVRDAGNGLVEAASIDSTSTLAADSLTIGAGAEISKHLSATATVGNGGTSVAADTCIVDAITVTGAASGDSVVATPPSGIEVGLLWSAYVSAANTVSVRLCNVSSAGVTSADLTWRIDVWQH